MKKGIIFGLVFAFCGGVMFSQNVDVKSLVNSKYYDELMKNGSVVLIKDDGSARLDLLPETEWKSEINKKLIQKEEDYYPYTYEALYFINKQDILKESNSSAEKIDISDVARVCRSISKMQGMKYYSTTRKKELVLYKQAFTVENETSSKPIPDKNTGNADGQVIYALQDDSSFGVNHYELKYKQTDNALLANFANKDTMGIGPFKAIYADKMIITILVIDCGENLLFYISDDLESVKFPGIKGQITDSITSRMEAIYKWFFKQF